MGICILYLYFDITLCKQRGFSMKGYKFSMDKVLELREKNEKKNITDYINSKSILDEEYSRLNKLQAEMEKVNIIDYLSDINSLNYKNLYKTMLNNKIDKQVDLIKNREREVELIRLNLLEAQKDKKIIEKLKEKDYDKYLTEIRAKEVSELDEIAILRYANKKIINI